MCTIMHEIHKRRVLSQAQCNRSLYASPGPQTAAACAAGLCCSSPDRRECRTHHLNGVPAKIGRLDIDGNVKKKKRGAGVVVVMVVVSLHDRLNQGEPCCHW